MKIILSLFVLLVGLSGFASESLVTLQPSEFSDQHDQIQKLTIETKWILFSTEMESFNMAKTAFEKTGLKSATEKNGLLVSDISKMPSLVTKMFALPKMRKYPFTVALDRKGDLTKTWPRTKGSLTLIKLDKLEVKEVSLLKSEEEVLNYIRAL